jgi:hypothetical protein
MSAALDRIKKAVSLKPQRKSVELPDGSEFEYYAPPITLAQRARAQKLAGDDNPSNFAIQLLVMIAQDEDGGKLFDTGDIAELKNSLPAAVVESLILQLLTEAEADEADLDPKGSQRTSRKTDS